MKSKKERKGESGAALVTVIMIAVLLGLACVFLLKAVGANSRDTTDVLSETKAYYAAESGLQSAINVLRNNSAIDYNTAVGDPTLGNELTYTTVNGVSQVTVGTEAGYSLNIVDPDNTAGFVTYHTDGNFLAANGGLAGTTKCVPDCTSAAYTQIQWTNAPTTNNTFNGTNSSLGSFTVTKVGGGAVISAPISFQIDYVLTSPRDAKRTIRGTINANATASDPIAINFPTQQYELLGSEIELCSTQTPQRPSQHPDGCDNAPLMPLTIVTSGVAVPIYANITPVQPYRLVVTSTGYGPNGAEKKLEGIIQKNFFNDLPSTSGLSMIGPGAGLNFSPGPGNPTYCGADPGIEPGETIPNHPGCTIDPNLPTAPAIGVSDPTGLQHVLDAAGNTTIQPPPAVITDGPDWQSSPAALDSFLRSLKATAQTNGRYVTNGNFQNTNNSPPYVNVSEWTSGQGITYCDGNCSTGPISGGGILVVTGNFTYSGNFNFRGTIIVTGSGGATRSGAGSGVILGNMVIAPYNPNNLAAGFGSPQFTTIGGGSSDLMFSGLSVNFDGTSAISNFMMGVAEK